MKFQTITMKTLLLLLCGIVLSGHALAQSDEQLKGEKASFKSNNSKSEMRDLMSELKGTYQIKVLNSKMVPALTMDDLLEIKNSRVENETIVLTKSSDIKIVVPSINEINSSAFKPLDAVVYLNSNY